MAMREAEAIAGTLTKTTKMPGYSYGLDAFQCHVGSELAKMPESTCENCFARRDLYLWKHTRAANKFRTEAITHPLWDLAMIELIAIKLVATAACVSLGLPGGLIGPTLVMGAATGGAQCV